MDSSDIDFLKALIKKQEKEIQRLEEEQQYYVDILAHIPNHVYWLNNENVYLGCNESHAKSVGLTSSKEIIGKTNFDMPWKDQAKKLNQLILKTGKSQILEESAILNNKLTTFLSQKVRLKNRKDEVIGILGISTEITQQKIIEHELRLAKEASESANKAKDVFIQNMSHDIRTPLTGIIGMSSILEQEVQKQEEKEHAHMVNISGEQLLSLLNSVLDIVKGGQEHHIHLKSFSVAQLLKDLRALVLPTAQLKHLDLILDIAESVPEFVISDYTKIHRIILNLLGNALKFTVQGHITLSAQASVPSIDNQCDLELEVKDTGVGIANEFKDQIFDRFFKITPSYKNQQQGYGVGLHIVQQYLEQLNGEISLESELGIGTTFKIKIPVQIDTSKKKLMNTLDKPIPNEASIVKSNTASGFILLIEDNIIALKMAEAIATNANCRYLSATSSEEAFELYKVHDFDLVLSDIGLPGMSGNQLAQAIRSYEHDHQKTAKPIIGLTAHAVDDAKAESLASGMDKVITKPIRLEVLKEVLAEFIPQMPINTIDKLVHTEPVSSSNVESELFELEQFALFDVEQALKNCGDNKALLIEMVTLMIHKELPEDCAQMKRAYDAHDYPLVERCAHKIKGGAVYIGTTRMKCACEYVERYLKSGQRDLFEPLYIQAINTIEDSCNHIRTWLHNQGIV